MAKPSVYEDIHEMVSFDDPNEARTWVFDVTFLVSNYSCIFGNGCKGVYAEDATELSQGCCTHGAHIVDKADREKLVTFAGRLTDEQWQFRSVALEREASFAKQISKKNDEGVHVTRVHDGACIFLNRPGFDGGAGCALHRAALEAGERPLDWKPEVCWQLPLRRLDDSDPYGHITSTIREWKRRDWGEGGDDFHWWCTDSSEAFVEKRPVWQTMGDEIEAMTGPAVYAKLAAFLRARSKQSNVTFLPHPKSRG